MKTIKILIVLFVGFLLNIQANVVGEINADFTINQGDINYNIPLKLPKGSAGFTPNLSISYNQNRGNGYLGEDFNLNAYSSISRKDGNIYLDGQLLISISENALQEGSWYTSRIDNFLRVYFNGDDFITYDKNGIETLYKKYNSIWIRTQVKNKYNNTINYVVNNDTSDQLFITNIQYANTNIELTYENRLDKRVGYDGFSTLRIQKRVKNILIKSNNILVKKYVLNYKSQSNINDSSKITDIKECTNDNCLEPISFEWIETNIKKITNSNKDTIEVQYIHLAKNATSKAKDAVSHLTLTSNANIFNTDYTYGALKNDIFQTITALNTTTNTKNITYYLSDYPYIGLIQKNENYIDDELVSKDEYTYDRTIKSSWTKIQSVIDANPITQNTSEDSIESMISNNNRAIQQYDSNKYTSQEIELLIGSYTTTRLPSFDWSKVSQNIITAHSNTISYYASMNYRTVYYSIPTATVLYIDPATIQLITKSNEIYENSSLIKSSNTTYSNYDDFNNAKTIITTNKNSNNEIIKTTTLNNTYDNNTNTWILSKLTSQTKTISDNEDTIVKNIAFTYNTKGSILSKTIEPNDINKKINTYTYDAFGNQLTSSINNNLISSVQYDANAINIIEKVNAKNHKETFISNDYGQVLTYTDANYLQTVNAYDDFFKQNYQSVNNNSLKMNISYSFDDSLTELKSYYKKTSTIDELPSIIEYFNNHNKLVRKIKVGFDGRDIYEDFYYDEFDNITKQSLPYFKNETASYLITSYDKYKRVTQKQKDIHGEISTIQTITYEGLTTTYTNANNQDKIVTRDIFGNIIHIQDEMQATQEYIFSVDNKLLKTIDSDGNTIEVRYDIFGNKIYLDDPDMGINTYTYNDLGQLVSQTDAKNKTTRYEYDKLGRKTREELSDQSTNLWLYDDTFKGKISIEYGNNNKHKKQTIYDTYGRIKEIKTQVDGHTFSKQFTYDKYSRIQTNTLPNDFKISNTYNEYGYLSEVNSNVNNTSYYKVLQKDAQNRVIQSINSSGVVTNNNYTKDGKLENIKSIKENVAQQIVPTSIGGLMDNFDNDLFNMYLKIEQYRTIISFIDNRKSKNMINNYKRKVRTLGINGLNDYVKSMKNKSVKFMNQYKSNQQIYTSFLDYYALHNVLSKAINEEIDDQNNILFTKYSNSQIINKYNLKIENMYKLIETRRQNITKLTKIDKTILNDVLNTSDSLGDVETLLLNYKLKKEEILEQIQHYEYTLKIYKDVGIRHELRQFKSIAKNNLDAIMQRLRYMIEWSNSNGRNRYYYSHLYQSIQDEITNEDSIKLLRSSDTLVINKYETRLKDLYEKYHNLSNNYLKLKTLYSLYENGDYQIDKLSNQQDNIIRDIHYEYDDLYNVSKQEDKKLNIIQNYTYDNLNRVTDVSINSTNNQSNLNYQYDTIGNIIYKSDIGDYTYSSSNPHQVIRVGDKHYKYDINGNMIKRDNTYINYNSFNKTKSISQSNKSSINFYYGANQKRYIKTTYKKGMWDNDTYYVNKDYEYTKDKSNTITHKYFIYVNNKAIAIYKKSYNTNTELSNLIYLYSNNLNSTDTITNDEGEVLQRFAYKPFGNKLILDNNGEVSSNQSISNRGYTGHEDIDEYNLVNMNARLYDPTLARFISADTIIPDAYDTQSFNRYTYVTNNPLKYTDPSGHMQQVSRSDVKSDWIEYNRAIYDTGSGMSYYDNHGRQFKQVWSVTEVYYYVPYTYYLMSQKNLNYHYAYVKIRGDTRNVYTGEVKGDTNGGLNTAGTSVVVATPVGGFHVSVGTYTNNQVNGFFVTGAAAYGKDYGVDATGTHYNNSDVSQLNGEFNTVTASLSVVAIGKVFDANNNHIGTSGGLSNGPKYGGHVTHGYGFTFGERKNNSSSELTLSP